MPANALMKADTLLTLPDDDMRHELVRGEHRVNPPSGAQHGTIQTRVGRLLDRYAEEHRLGIVITECGFLLARDPDTVRAPDVAFVRGERLPGGVIPTGYIAGAPDLAVEIVSPSDTLYDVEEKVDAYLAAGGPLVWVVNPKRRTVTVYAPGAQPHVLHESETLGGGDVLPAFTCVVRDVMV